MNFHCLTFLTLGTLSLMQAIPQKASAQLDFKALSADDIRVIIRQAPPLSAAEAPARILYSKTDWVIYTADAIEKREEVLLEILGDQAKHEFGDLQIPFDARYTTISIHAAETWMSDGSVLPIMEGADNELIPPELSEAAVYGDLKSRIISFSGAEVGAVLHWRISVRSEYPAGNRIFWDSMPLQKDIPIENLQFTLIAPVLFPVHTQLCNGADSPETSNSGGWNFKRWSLQSVPPVVREWQMPHMNNIVPRIMVTAATDLNGLGEWFRKIFEAEDHAGFDAEGPLFEAAMMKIADSETAVVIDRSVRFVADQIKTIELPVGSRGFQASPPEEILKRGYGDTLDKARLLKSLLTKNGIETDIVFLPGSRDRSIGRNGDFPSLDGCDRMVVIAKLDSGREIWMDPSDRNARPGWVYRGDGVRGIRFSGKRVSVVDVPIPDPSESMSRRTVTISVDEEGKIAGTMKWEGSGWFEHHVRELMRDLPPRQRKIRIERDLNDATIPITVNRMEMPDWGDFRVIPEIKVAFTSSRAGLKTADMMVIPLPDMPLNSGRVKVPVIEPGRKQAVELNTSGLESVRITVDLPEGYDLVYHPGNGKVDNRIVQVIQTVDIIESKYQLLREYHWKASRMEPDVFETTTTDFGMFSHPSENILILRKRLEN